VSTFGFCFFLLAMCTTRSMSALINDINLMLDLPDYDWEPELIRAILP